MVPPQIEKCKDSRRVPQFVKQAAPRNNTFGVVNKHQTSGCKPCNFAFLPNGEQAPLVSFNAKIEPKLRFGSLGSTDFRINVYSVNLKYI